MLVPFTTIGSLVLVTLLASFLQIDELMGGLAYSLTWLQLPCNLSLKLLCLVVSHFDIFVSVIDVDF